MARRTPKAPLAVTIPEFAKLINVSVATAYRLAADGRIPTVKFGPKLMRVPLDLVKEQMAEAAAR